MKRSNNYDERAPTKATASTPSLRHPAPQFVDIVEIAEHHELALAGADDAGTARIAAAGLRDHRACAFVPAAPTQPSLPVTAGAAIR